MILQLQTTPLDYLRISLTAWNWEYNNNLLNPCCKLSVSHTKPNKIITREKIIKIFAIKTFLVYKDA